MNRNKKNDAVKQNKAIQYSNKSATFDALKQAENKKNTDEDNKSW